MIAVIFEFEPAEGRRDDYLARAAEMGPRAEAQDGFVSVERYESLTTPGKFLSVSFYEDEAALDRWRLDEAHRRAQRAGREGVFADYRLRVVKVLRDYTLENRDEAPEDSREEHG